MGVRSLCRCYMSPEEPAYHFGVNRAASGYELLMWRIGESSPVGRVDISDAEAALLARSLLGEWNEYEDRKR